MATDLLTMAIARADVRRCRVNRVPPAEQLCIPGCEPLDEREVKRRELSEQKRKRRDLLEILNVHARRLVHENVSMARIGVPNVICSDWVRESAGIKRIAGIRFNNYLGVLFTARIPGKPRWEPCGFYNSKFPGSHNRMVRLWKQSAERWPE